MSTNEKSNLTNADETSMVVTRFQTQAPLQSTTNGITPLQPQEVQTAYVQWLPPAPIGMHYVLLPNDQNVSSINPNTTLGANVCYLCNAIANHRCTSKRCARLILFKQETAPNRQRHTGNVSIENKQGSTKRAQ
ncbi:unnamed protein product, partial [Didymodactylos carnosus]